MLRYHPLLVAAGSKEIFYKPPDSLTLSSWVKSLVVIFSWVTKPLQGRHWQGLGVNA